MGIEDHAVEGRTKAIEKLVVIDEGKRMIACRRGGGVELYDIESSKYEKINSWSRGKKDLVVGLVYDDGNIIICSNTAVISRINISNDEVSEVEIERDGKELSCFVQSPFDKDTYAIGGRDWDVELVKLDFEKKKVEKSFKGKNVKNDRLNMAVPIWITNVHFLSTTRFITTTGYGQIRIYDVTKGRRPTNDVKVSERSIKPLVAGSPDNVVFADNHSNVNQFSIKQQKLGGKYHGFTGAAQALHSTETLLAAGGLDRYLRVFNLTTREQVAKVFIGTHVVDLCILDDRDELEKRKKEEVEDDDEMWKELNEKSKKIKK